MGIQSTGLPAAMLSAVRRAVQRQASTSTRELLMAAAETTVTIMGLADIITVDKMDVKELQFLDERALRTA